MHQVSNSHLKMNKLSEPNVELDTSLMQPHKKSTTKSWKITPSREKREKSMVKEKREKSIA